MYSTSYLESWRWFCCESRYSELQYRQSENTNRDTHRDQDGRMREGGKDVDSESEDDIPPWMLEIDPVSLREEIKVRITS